MPSKIVLTGLLEDEGKAREGTTYRRRCLMEGLTAYCLALRKKCEILEPSVVTLKSGRKAVRGRAKDAPQYNVFRLVNASEAEQVESMRS